MKPEFETPFYWFWFCVLLQSRTAFESYHVFINALLTINSIAPKKFSNLGGLLLVSSLKPCLFYSPFCYPQNVDFEGSNKNGTESLCSEYRHYWSEYLLSSTQES